MGALIKLPSAATPADRILARFNRNQLAGFIEVAISLLDAADAAVDPDAPDFAPRSDAMPGDPADAEPTGDDQGDVSWSEWQTRGRRKLSGRGANASEPMARTDGIGMVLEDDEDDDPTEANGDEIDTNDAEDERLTDFAERYAIEGPGCVASDPPDRDGSEDGVCISYGTDQTREISEGEAFHDRNNIPLIRVPLPENDQ